MISEWVHVSHNMNKITGFITATFDDMVAIQVTIPRNYGQIVIHREKIIPSDETIWLDDIPTLIDLSLAIGDREWFEKWTHELSLWKKASDVLPKAIDANESA